MVTTLESMVRELCREADGRHPGKPRSLEAARALIRTELHAAGFKVESDSWNDGAGKRQNILGRLGSGTRVRILMAAHYDTVPGSPGADDNASSVAALLCAAHIIAAAAPEAGIDLGFFDGCEGQSTKTGASGSRRAADGLSRDERRIGLMVCLDMLGCYHEGPWKANFERELWMTAVEPPVRDLVDSLEDRADFLSISGFEGEDEARELGSLMARDLGFPIAAAGFPGGANPVLLSDGRHFHAAGIPTVLVGDTGFLRNPGHHGPGDRPETLDYGRLAAVTCSLARACLDLALAKKPEGRAA